MNNQTYAQIETAGYVTVFQTNFSGGVNGEVKFKLGRATGTAKEYNVFWTDPAGMRTQQAGQTNYTGFNVAVQVNDTVGAYFDTGVGNTFYCQYVEASMPAYYKHNADVTGTQVFTDTVAGRGLAIRVLVGWNNPAGPVYDWGDYVIHGFGLVGIGLIIIGGVNFAFKVTDGDTQNAGRALGWLFLMAIIGIGLIFAWIGEF
jgi:hypothetical protein